jgi:hypothetical protein
MCDWIQAPILPPNPRGFPQCVVKFLQDIVRIHMAIPVVHHIQYKVAFRFWSGSPLRVLETPCDLLATIGVSDPKHDWEHWLDREMSLGTLQGNLPRPDPGVKYSPEFSGKTIVSTTCS